MLAALLLAASMLTVDDQSYLRNTRFLTQDRDQISGMMQDRPVVLARATAATYSGIAGGSVTVMQFSLQPQSLQPGDQIEIRIGGYGNNNSGGAIGVGATAQVLSGNAVTQTGYTARTPATGANKYAWESTIHLGFSLPNVSGQYVKAITAGATPSSRAPAKQLVNQQLWMLGEGNTLISDTTLFGASAGGFLLGAGGGPNGSAVKADYQPFTLDMFQPLVIGVILSDVSSASAPITVTYGYVLGL